MYILTLFCFLPLSEAYHSWNERWCLMAKTWSAWYCVHVNAYTRIRFGVEEKVCEHYRSLPIRWMTRTRFRYYPVIQSVKLFSKDFDFMVGFAKRKNFSKPIDKFRIMCYYVILRIYLLGFPWYDYIIIHLIKKVKCFYSTYWTL